MHCRNCQKKTKQTKIISVGRQCLSGIYPKKRNALKKKYALDLFKCTNCDLIQIGKSIPLKFMYGLTYGYYTSLSKLMVRHIIAKYYRIKRFIKLKNNDHVLDIGCNDGTFLNFLLKKNKKLNCLGIDPTSKKYKHMINKKIKVIFDYFSLKNIKKHINKKFKLICAFAMFYDVETPNCFCKEINKLLTNDGIFILELSYLPLLIKNMTYDQICHEHVAYYSLKVLKRLLQNNGLRIIDVKLNYINGGSFEIICAKKSSKLKSNIFYINKLLKEEDDLLSKKSIDNFNTRLKNSKNTIVEFFELIKKNGQKIMGYGASTKGNIVLNYCNINNKYMKEICDANSYKFGRFTPGTNIKIVSKQMIKKRKPNYLFVLIWPFRKEVIKQELSFIKNGGKLVFALPIFHIVDKNNYREYLKRDLSEFKFSLV